MESPILITHDQAALDANELIIYINVATSTLSIIGSCLIIISLVINRLTPNFTARLLIKLSLSYILFGVAPLLNFLTNSAGISCSIEEFIHQFAWYSSIAWNFLITLTIYLTIGGIEANPEKLTIYFNASGLLLPFGFSAW